MLKGDRQIPVSGAHLAVQSRDLTIAGEQRRMGSVPAPLKGDRQIPVAGSELGLKSRDLRIPGGQPR